MEYIIPIYSDQDLSPRAAEVIRAIVDDAFPEHVIKFRQATVRDHRILVFGRCDWSGIVGHQFIYTYSIAQIMSKANAASVLAAGIRNFITEPERIPFHKPVALYSPVHLDTLYLDQPVVIDIETDGNLGKEHTPEEVRILTVGVYQPGHPPLVFNNFRDGKSLPLTDSQLVTLAEYLPKFKYAIYHNGKFDTRVLNRVLGVKLDVWFDTMLAHHVLNHAAGDHKLKTLARRYLGAPEWEKDLSKYTKGGGHYELIPPDKLVEYNGWDVYWTYKLYEFLSPQIAADDSAQVAFNLEMQAANFLLDVEMYGIPYDVLYSLGRSITLDGLAELHKGHLEMITWPGFNPGSWQQVKKWLEECDVFLPDTSEESIQLVIEKYPGTDVRHQFADELLKYRKAVKMNGTYFKGWREKSRHNRVHPTFLVHGTSTGRLSSTSPNAQNVPRDKTIRKMVKTQHE